MVPRPATVRCGPEEARIIGGCVDRCQTDRDPVGSTTCAGPKPCQRTAMAASRDPRIAGPPPDMAMLYDAALAYLARYAATELSLRRVLERRVERWARLAGGSGDPESIAESAAVAREAVRAVVARLAAAGAVNDTTYAESRALSLRRAGRSRRAVTAHLAAKGVSSEIARAAVPNDDASELGGRACTRATAPPGAVPEWCAAGCRRVSQGARRAGAGRLPASGGQPCALDRSASGRGAGKPVASLIGRVAVVGCAGDHGRTVRATAISCPDRTREAL